MGELDEALAGLFEGFELVLVWRCHFVDVYGLMGVVECR